VQFKVLYLISKAFAGYITEVYLPSLLLERFNHISEARHLANICELLVFYSNEY